MIDVVHLKFCEGSTNSDQVSKAGAIIMTDDNERFLYPGIVFEN